MISYLLICAAFSGLSLFTLRSSYSHLSLQKTLCGLAIALWCVPWPYLSNAFSSTAVKIISLDEYKSSAVAVAAQSIKSAPINVNSYILSVFQVLLAVGFCIYIVRIYRHRSLCKKLLASAKSDKHLESLYGGRWFRVASLETPMLIGLWQPKILLPLELRSDAELELMIKHELRHRESYDHFKIAVLGVLQSIFFWNPLVQALILKQRNLIEVDCDLRVARGNPVAYRQLLSELALRSNGFDLSCSMAMGNITWRLKMMDRIQTQYLFTWKNAALATVLTVSLLLSVGGLLGSGQALAVEKPLERGVSGESFAEAEGALLNLLIEASKSDAGETRERSMESNIWIQYNKKAEFILGEEWKLHLTLVKKENDTVFLATQLIDLTADDQVVNEPQMLIGLGKEAKIEVGTESWRYAATFVVTEVPLERVSTTGAD